MTPPAPQSDGTTYTVSLTDPWLTVFWGSDGLWGRLVECFEFYRGEFAEALLASSAVVGGLDSRDDGEAESVAAGPGVPV